MRVLPASAAIGLLVWGAQFAKAGPDVPMTPETCGKHGTAVEFVATPSAAAARAKAESKLVFVLHVSGHFEDPAFT
jgi:hypothetical protein